MTKRNRDYLSFYARVMAVAFLADGALVLLCAVIVPPLHVFIPAVSGIIFAFPAFLLLDPLFYGAALLFARVRRSRP